MNHTTNYNLPQWEDGDRVTRGDFNDAMSAIDGAIKAVSDNVPGIVIGTYTGNGEESQDINLGFQPKAVLVTHSTGTIFHYINVPLFNGGLAMRGNPAKLSTYNILTVTSTGFRVYCHYISGSNTYINSNANTNTYYYIAFK